MHWLKRMNLKKQFYALILIALILLVLLQGVNLLEAKRLLNERAGNAAAQLMDSVELNIDSMVAGIKSSASNLSYSTYVQELMVEEDPVKSWELYLYVREIMVSTKSSNSNIYSVTLLSNGTRKISDPLLDDTKLVAFLQESYDVKNSDFRSPFFTETVTEPSSGFAFSAYVFPVYSYPYSSQSNSRSGTGLMVLDLSSLNELVSLSGITENSLFVILDQSGSVVMSNRGLKAGERYEDIFTNGEGGGENAQVMYEGQKAIVQYRELESIGWKVISVIPVKELSSELDPLLWKGLLFGVGSVILLFVTGWLFTQNVTEPVAELTDFLSHIEEASLKTRLKIPYDNEIGLIANNINQMLDKVEHMTRKILDNQTALYEAKLAEQRAEVLALQSQINPHFLYNTLNCLSNIGLAYDVKEVADISTAMSNIFRYSIKGEDVVRLREEIGCIKEYLRIMEIRYAGKFEVEIRAEEALLDQRILKMILQPIVENAMYHGLERKNGKGHLEISCRLTEQDVLIFCVTDDGKGMSGEELAALRESIDDYEHIGLYCSESRGIGLANINKRIRLKYGDRYGLEIESGENAGTKVTMCLPASEGEE